MKTITVSSDSWHYKLATCFDRPMYDPNICVYGRKMVIGLFLVSLIALIAIGALFCIGDLLGLIIACIANKTLIEPYFGAFLALAFLGLFGVIGLAAFILILHEERGVKFFPEPVREAYSAWKDKVCYRVDVT